MPKTSISDLMKVQIFPGSVSPYPLLYMSYKTKSNSTPIKCKKAYQIECFFGKKKTTKNLHLGNVSCTIDKALKVSPAVFLFKNRLLMQCHLVDNVCSLLTAIQNFYLICVQLFIFHFLSALFFLSSSFFFGGGGGGGHLN